MLIKDGAVVAGLDYRMRKALVIAGNIWRDNGRDLVVTEGLGGEHSDGSLHYYGLAVDLRIHYFGDDTKQKVFEELKAKCRPVNMAEAKRYRGPRYRLTWFLMQVFG